MMSALLLGEDPFGGPATNCVLPVAARALLPKHDFEYRQWRAIIDDVGPICFN